MKYITGFLIDLITSWYPIYCLSLVISGVVAIPLLNIRMKKRHHAGYFRSVEVDLKHCLSNLSYQSYVEFKIHHLEGKLKE